MPSARNMGANQDDELEELYRNVLMAYRMPILSTPAIRSSIGSTSGPRAPRPLPPTPGGSMGRTPIPPTTRLPPASLPESSSSRIDTGPPPSPNRTPQRPPLEIDTILPSQDTPASVTDSVAVQRWSEVPGNSPNEYLDPDVIPVPEYIPNLADDPNATNPYPVVAGSQQNNGEFHAFADAMPYVEDHSFERERLPHEDEERPPYEADPSYQSYYEGTVHENDEGGTHISDFAVLQPPPERERISADSSLYLPYIDHESAGPNTASMSEAIPSSIEEWNPHPPPTADFMQQERADWNARSNVAGPSRDPRRRVTNDPAVMRNFDPRTVIDTTTPTFDDDYDAFDDPAQFINLALLSHIAVQLQLKVPRSTHVKGTVPYPKAFTGKDIVTTIQGILEQKLIRDHGCERSDRRVALQVARSLQTQLFFAEVEWGSRTLQDGVGDVYTFLDDSEMASLHERAELPSGVVTMLTGCYSVTCGEGGTCYSGSCPTRGMDKYLVQPVETAPNPTTEDWTKGVPLEVLRQLPEFEINRQTIIHKLITKEELYIKDLDLVETVFIQPLRKSPVIQLYMVDDFIEEVFGNILQLRDCNRRLLEVMYVRQREEAPIIKTIGDIFLEIATQFRKLYPSYVGRQFLAAKRLKDELDNNAEFRLFIEQCERQLNGTRNGQHRLDLWHYLNRPTEHLQKYPVLLQAVYQATARENPDGDFLQAAISAITNLQDVAQLRTFQSAMGKGIPGKWEWHDLMTPNMRKMFTKEESQRQSLIFELIKGEMTYVRDLESIENIYRRPLQEAEPPIIPHDRIDKFFAEVFHRFHDLLNHHTRLVKKLHEIQLEEHPRISSITAAIFDAALNFREAYVEYIPNYPIAAYRIDDEFEHNPLFRRFVEDATRHPDAERLDMKSFLHRPIPRVQRYELLLKEILTQTPTFHEDRAAIPEVIDLLRSLLKETQPGVESAKQKVEVWTYNSHLVYRPGEAVDMDLLNEHRSLVHTGKLLFCEDGRWNELFVMLFDNYLVWTRPKEKDGVTKYHLVRKPMPLDLVHPVNFSEVAIIRNPNRFGRPNTPLGRNSDPDPRNIFPFTLHLTGRQGNNFTLAAESAKLRTEWTTKLEEALGLRKAVADSNKVFEIETLSNETFLVPPVNLGPTAQTMYDGVVFTGRVTCSVPFKTAGNRGLVAIGCAEGVWIGFQQDPKSMRRVLHVKNVTQCAMLEDFGLFLVLSDKNLFAYHIEALVPNPLNPQPYTSQTPHRINGSKEVQFFSVGMQHGRTLVIYMNKKNNDSVFHVVEPVIDKINERPKAASSSIIPSGLFPKKHKSDWFRPYRDFFLQGESYDMIFLKAKVSVLCSKGFEIVDLTDFKTVTIPQKDNPGLGPAAKRCETCRPMGMFRSSEDEFLLCYNEFGIYVDKHGAPSRSSGAIEWEGTAERVALHAPYILIFDSRFIEIRHMDTCRLSQIIPGNDLRCIWDGRGTDISHAAIPADASEEHFVQEPRVHAVMSETSTQPGGRGIRGISQHVFQLIPTIPLYLPGALTSPSHVNYYPQSYSPPRSPVMRGSSSYRP